METGKFRSATALTFILTAFSYEILHAINVMGHFEQAKRSLQNSHFSKFHGTLVQ
jgi:hypothetical protein